MTKKRKAQSDAQAGVSMEDRVSAVPGDESEDITEDACDDGVLRRYAGTWGKFDEYLTDVGVDINIRLEYLIDVYVDYLLDIQMKDLMSGGQGLPEDELILRAVHMTNMEGYEASPPKGVMTVIEVAASRVMDLVGAAWSLSRRGLPQTYHRFVYDMWEQSLRALRSAGTSGMDVQVKNPVVKFKKMAEHGEFDDFSDADYHMCLDEVQAMSEAWSSNEYVSAAAVASRLLQKLVTGNGRNIRLLSGVLAGCRFVPPAGLEDPLTVCGMEKPAGEKTDIGSLLDQLSAERRDRPADIYGRLQHGVYGQDEAKRAAAMIVWHSMHGTRSNVAFCGPTGCGKSEIWRVLSRAYPGRIRMVDFSRMAGDGWSGSMHLRDVFEGLDLDKVRDEGLVVVLDEADKILCERAIGAGGTNYNQIVQQSLLKLLDGDTVEFGADHGKTAFSVDARNVSVVLLGAFERMVDGKDAERHGIGFGNNVEKGMGYDGLEVTYEDMIKAGMRREVAGRINKVVRMSPLTEADYREIVDRFVVPGLSTGSYTVSVDGPCKDGLVREAVDTKLGVRWIRSKLANRLDDLIFDDPDRDEYHIANM